MPDDGKEEHVVGIVTKTAPGPVSTTVAALIQSVQDRGMTVFATVDHSGEARRRGLTLRDTVVVIFGSPAAGTPVMQASPLAALDLPLKVLVWDDDGHTRVSYTDPDVMAARHHLPNDLAARLTGIGPLTDELAS